MDNFSFSLGKIYAITGKSGCGKTSSLIDFKAGVYGALSSNGTISLPLIDENEAKIMFVNQKLYLPKGATLLETIYFPAILDLLNAEQISKIRTKIISLLKEISIDEFSDDSENTNGLLGKLDNKEFKLSGGQEKKIAVVQAILTKADIYIFDETLAGLDSKSAMIVQQMLRKYLPDATFLVVDHHAEDNNYDGFYDLEVNFASGTVTEKKIQPKMIDNLTEENNTCTNFEVLPSGENVCQVDVISWWTL